jgi:TRAP transporter 4TM/12TM fusion protein
MTQAQATGEGPPLNSDGLRGGWSIWTGALLAALPLFGLVYAFNVPSYFGFAMLGEQAALVVLGLSLGATFLLSRPDAARQLSGRPPWPDAAMSFASMGICLWTAYHYGDLVGSGYTGSGWSYYLNIGLAVGTLLLLLEALRRLTGWAMVILVLACFAYALVADKMPGAFRGATPELGFLLRYLHLDSSGILGTALSVVVTTVIAYVLLGNALFRFGGGQMFLDLALAGMGRYRGGPAKAAVLASSMFGSISGSAVANVAATGIVTIPLMKRVGYRPEQAGAIEAVASTGGQLLPPIMGAAAFIMAEFLGIPYADVALAALFPALLFYIALMAQIHLHAARNGLRPLTKEERPDAGAALRKYWPFLVPIVLLMLLLFIWRWQPEQAAFASLLAVLAATLFVGEQSIGPRALLAVFRGAGRSLLEIVTITAAAGIIVGILSLTGLSFSLGLAIVDAAGSVLFVLLVISAITAIVFGMGMPTTAVYVLMATLVAPALMQAGIQPLAAHMFVLYFGMLSMITPPVCLASFTAASMAGAPFMSTGWQSVRFGAVAFIVPFMFVMSPAMLLQGDDWTASARALMTGVLGSVLFAVAIEGYLFRALAWVGRVFAALAGLMLIMPDGPESRFLAHVPTAGIGLLLGLAVVAWAWWGRARLVQGGVAGTGCRRDGGLNHE